MKIKLLRSIALLSGLIPLWVQAAGVDLSIKVAPNITAQVTGVGGAYVSVRFSPGGTTQRLEVEASDEEGHYNTEVADFNFDGDQDLAFKATLGEVNETYQVFNFDPHSGRFVELRFATTAPVNCDGLSNLKPDAKSRILYSSCRGGPMWFTDAYKFDASGSMYVYQSTRLINSDAVQKMFAPESGVEDVPGWLLLTYDKRGKIIGRSMMAHAYETHESQGRVSVEKLPLYDRPAHDQTRRYLVRGDLFDAQDISDNEEWLKIAYRNAAKGKVEGWINVSEATTAR
jgi:hypothetical protein